MSLKHDDGRRDFRRPLFFALVQFPSDPASMPLRRLLSRVSLASIALAGIAGAQQAPHFPSDDATLERIWRLGMDSSHVQQLAQTLFDSIGPRLTGGPGIKAASDWVISTYKSWGIDAQARAVRHLARLAARRVAHRSRHAARALARGDDARLESRARRDAGDGAGDHRSRNSRTARNS